MRQAGLFVAARLTTLIGARRSVYSKKCSGARSAGCSHHTDTS